LFEKRRFITTHYKRKKDLNHQPQRHEYKNVEEYYKEMEMLLVKCEIDEGLNLTIPSFLNGKNQDIFKML